MGTFLKVALGVLVGGVVLIVVVGVVVYVVFREGTGELQESSDELSITLAEYESVETGETTLEEIEARFGEPFFYEESRPEDDPEAPLELECIAYHREGELASDFRFCFDSDGVVESKKSE